MDGQTILVPRSKVNLIREVNDELTKETTLTIEEVEYKKMIIRDVNNYCAVYSDYTPENNHCKFKGCFEIDKEYFKDPSMRIVPIALKQYYIDNIPIRDTIINHTDIYDFCLRLKTDSKSTPKYQYVKDRKIMEQILDRTTRYYISNDGGILCKEFNDGRITGVNIGYNVTLFNKYIKKDIKDYNLNYNFYISECNKITNVIDEGKIPTLFD